MLQTGFNLWDFVSKILDFMEKCFNWLLNFYPFDDVPISLFYFLCGGAVLSLVFHFFPGSSHGSVDLEDDPRPFSLFDDDE